MLDRLFESLSEEGRSKFKAFLTEVPEFEAAFTAMTAAAPARVESFDYGDYARGYQDGYSDACGNGNP